MTDSKAVAELPVDEQAQKERRSLVYRPVPPLSARFLQTRIRQLLADAQQQIGHQRRVEAENAVAAAHIANLEDQIQVLRYQNARLAASVRNVCHELETTRDRTETMMTRWRRIQDSGLWPLLVALMTLENHWPRVWRALMQVPRFLVWMTRGQRVQFIQIRKSARRILAADLFDGAWYVQQYPEVVSWNDAPILHWLHVGWQQGFNPHALFDVTYYQQQRCTETNTESAQMGALDPVTHYLCQGDRCGYAPHPLFDGAWYRQQVSDDVLGSSTALTHYLRHGAISRRDPHPLFDSVWYLAQWPQQGRQIANPLQHYLQIGQALHYSPHPLFDSAWYDRHYFEARMPHQEPLQHFLQQGVQDGYDPNPLFATRWYQQQAQLSVENPLCHYLHIGATMGYDPHPLFATRWYLEHNLDVALSGQNPLAHYLHYGGLEGRDPSPRFCTSCYLTRYPHLREQGLNPLVHFVAHYPETDPEQVMVHAVAAPDEQVARHFREQPATALGEYLGRGHPFAYLENFHPSKRFILDVPSFQPTITVIVPNYNHAEYLSKRLDSIYQQTYRHIEVLLLDDASSDHSRSILQQYADRYSEITRTVFNDTSSGGAFRQWQRGIELARSELIWIAESDDTCDDDFLESLVPFFMDEAVRLAYADSCFIDEQGQPTPFQCVDYLQELSTTKWTRSYVATAHREVCDVLGRKNTIPNVSAVVFRKPDLQSLLTDTPWRDLRICGDWLFYLHLIRGGKLAYTPLTRNYYRLHRHNTSAQTYKTATYYQEHALIASEIARLYAVPQATLDDHKRYVERFYRENGNELEGQGMSLSLLYDSTQIMQTAQQRLPNLLMGIFGFATGGGEVFPIHLANALRRQGYALTVFNFAGEPLNGAVRDLLDPEIAVVERTTWFSGVAWLIEQFGIELVHSHHASVDQVLALAKHDLAVDFRHIVTMHGMYESMEPWIFQATLEQIGAQVDQWVFIAEKNLQPFKAFGCYQPERFTRIQNGMPSCVRQPITRAQLGIAEHAFVVCLASRAIVEKGWSVAIAMIERARLLSTRDIVLLLLGDGVVYDELAAHGVPAFVHLLGFVKEPAAYFAIADLGLLPSTFKGESFPLTAIECLAVGRPFMATDVGELRYMLTVASGDIAGELIALENGAIPVEYCVQCLVRLANDESYYRHKVMLAQQIASRFTLEMVLQQYMELYQTQHAYC
jgi:glycosyltransferase involved in cell wall biosynthesis